MTRRLRRNSAGPRRVAASDSGVCAPASCPCQALSDQLSEVPGVRPGPRTSALYADELLQLRHDLDQVALLLHHPVDVLVGTRNLIEHAGVLAALHSPRLLLQIP